MIGETLVLKALAAVGAYTVANKTIVPASEWVGKQVGKGFAKMLNRTDKRGNNHPQKKVAIKDDEMISDAALEALLAECEQALSEEPFTEPAEIEVLPVSRFDQETLDWMDRCRCWYGATF